MSATLWFDGACEPRNPGGTATWGYVLRVEDGRDARDHGLAAKAGSPMATNNVAEYMGLLHGLKAARRARVKRLAIRGDSLLVIRQVQGKFAVKAPRLVELHAEAKRLLAGFEGWEATWIPRARNGEADHETRLALLEAGVPLR